MIKIVVDWLIGMMEDNDQILIDSLEKNFIPEKIGSSSSQISSSKTIHIFSIDEYLEYVGQLGRYQAIIIIVCSFLFFVPAHQSLLMVFVAHSPPWVCRSTQDNYTTSACISSVFHYEGQPGFNSRCDYARSEWKYTLPASHSIVSEVLDMFFSYLLDF